MERTDLFYLRKGPTGGFAASSMEFEGMEAKQVVVDGILRRGSRVLGCPCRSVLEKATVLDRVLLWEDCFVSDSLAKIKSSGHSSLLCQYARR